MTDLGRLTPLLYNLFDFANVPEEAIMAKLRHIALSVPDPEATADFFCEAFDMKRVGRTDSPLAKGCYVSDGTITMALLKYKSDKWAGYVEGEDERGAEWVGIHHFGFWVDDLNEAEEKIEKAGGRYFMGRPEEDAPTTFYEMKFKDPNGIIMDVTHLGWGGAVKEVVPADEATREKQEKRDAKAAKKESAKV